MKENLLRRLPSVDALLGRVETAPLVERFGREAVLAAVRASLDETRKAILVAGTGTESEGRPVGAAPEAIMARAEAGLEARFARTLRRAINATGILMHSGLGRAVLSADAREALDEAVRGFCTLALDIDSGKRGQRDAHVAGLLRELTGAEAATICNNNSAATILVLNSLARGKEVIVSRGQLVEIGGSFRMPEVMAMSGAVMREVGTTNKTHLRDYADAIGPDTGAILRVHHSNYRILGFHSEPGIEELAELGRQRGIPVVDDHRKRRPRRPEGLRPGERAAGPGQHRGRCGRGLLQRRQAHRRPAVGNHRRPGRRRGPDQEEPAGPGHEVRQADLGGHGSDAAAVPGARQARGAPPALPDAVAQARGSPEAGRRHGHASLRRSCPEASP